MNVAVLRRSKESRSFRIYRESLAPHLLELGVGLWPFNTGGPIPDDCDLVWDPGLGMTHVPGILHRVRMPLVVTVHGLRAFSLPISELGRSWTEGVNLLLSRWLRRREWARLRNRVAMVITVSRYGAEEAEHGLGVPHTRIRPIPHGVAHEIFHPEGESARNARPYFLHVSANQTVKNVERAVAAYLRLPSPRPDFILVLAGYKGRVQGGPGVKVVRTVLTPAELARWYRGATALVLPSLRETFGLPILEAMACGCPVLTSKTGGCPEVAGDAAILVDPRSSEQITGAMQRLAQDDGLRGRLRQEGRERARAFSWRRSAERHLAVFQSALGGGRARIRNVSG